MLLRFRFYRVPACVFQGVRFRIESKSQEYNRRILV